MTAIEDAAARLREARASAVPCAPVRELLPGGTVEDAYAVQRINTELVLQAGRRLIGWKIGLTNPVVQRQLGVDQPDFGALFADESVGDELPVAPGLLLQPRVEAEVAFVLDRDLGSGPITPVDVIRATAFVLPAIEIVDSRVSGWDITIVDTVADNASSGLHVLGPKPTRLTDVDLRAVRMAMTASGEVVSEGSGASCLSHPVNAVVWLANTLAGLGQPLREGDLVLSGALGAMVPVKPGVTYEATIDGLGTVRAAFAEDE
jgi:2-keto-4-pentenoate hydratase